MIANLQKEKDSQITKKGQQNDSVDKNLLPVLRMSLLPGTHMVEGEKDSESCLLTFTCGPWQTDRQTHINR